MTSGDFEIEDRREAEIFRLVGESASVLWRTDLPWHQGMAPKDRHVVGFVRGESGAEIFMASAREWFGDVRAHVYMRAAVADVCREGSPGGDVAAADFNVKGVFDSAVVIETVEMGDIRHVGKTYSNASAVYLIRVAPDFGGADRLAVAIAWKDGGQYAKAKVCVDLPFREVIEMAQATDAGVSLVS